MGALSRFVRKHFDTDTTYRDTPLTNTVAVTPTQLWVGDADRLEIIFVNQSTNTITIGTGPNVAVDVGFRLDAGGGVIVFLAEEDGELVGREFWGIAAGNSAIYSGEVVAL